MSDKLLFSWMDHYWGGSGAVIVDHEDKISIRLSERHRDVSMTRKEAKEMAYAILNELIKE